MERRAGGATYSYALRNDPSVNEWMRTNELNFNNYMTDTKKKRSLIEPEDWNGQKTNLA